MRQMLAGTGADSSRQAQVQPCSAANTVGISSSDTAALRTPLASTADLDHGLARSPDAEEPEAMAVAFLRDRFFDRRHDGVLSAALEHAPQIDGVVVGETSVQRPRRRQPQPVAGVAEVLGERRDDAEALDRARRGEARGRLEAKVAGGAGA